MSGNNPAYMLRSDLAGVRALPLLSGLADFDKIDGKMQARLAFRSGGLSQRAIISGLSGTAFVVFQDGAIRDLNIAKMIRSLTSGTLSGWQQGRDQTTDLTQLSASFRIEQGQATTSDLTLAGPLVRMTGAGTVDLPAKTLVFRVEPKLVLTTEGQGSAANPVGLGIPVVIEGPWAEPRIYPEVAAYCKIPMRPMQSSRRWARACSARAASAVAPPPAWRQARRNLGQPAAAGIGQPPHDPAATRPGLAAGPNNRLRRAGSADGQHHEAAVREVIAGQTSSRA